MKRNNRFGINERNVRERSIEEVANVGERNDEEVRTTDDRSSEETSSKDWSSDERDDNVEISNSEQDKITEQEEHNVSVDDLSDLLQLLRKYVEANEENEVEDFSDYAANSYNIFLMQYASMGTRNVSVAAIKNVVFACIYILKKNIKKFTHQNFFFMCLNTVFIFFKYEFDNKLCAELIMLELFNDLLHSSKEWGTDSHIALYGKVYFLHHFLEYIVTKGWVSNQKSSGSFKKLHNIIDNQFIQQCVEKASNERTERSDITTNQNVESSDTFTTCNNISRFTFVPEKESIHQYENLGNSEHDKTCLTNNENENHKVKARIYKEIKVIQHDIRCSGNTENVENKENAGNTGIKKGEINAGQDGYTRNKKDSKCLENTECIEVIKNSEHRKDERNIEEEMDEENELCIAKELDKLFELMETEEDADEGRAVFIQNSIRVPGVDVTEEDEIELCDNFFQTGDIFYERICDLEIECYYRYLLLENDYLNYIKNLDSVIFFEIYKSILNIVIEYNVSFYIMQECVDTVLCLCKFVEAIQCLTDFINVYKIHIKRDKTRSENMLCFINLLILKGENALKAYFFRLLRSFTFCFFLMNSENLELRMCAEVTLLHWLEITRHDENENCEKENKNYSRQNKSRRPFAVGKFFMQIHYANLTNLILFHIDHIQKLLLSQRKKDTKLHSKIQEKEKQYEAFFEITETDIFGKRYRNEIITKKKAKLFVHPLYKTERKNLIRNNIIEIESLLSNFVCFFRFFKETQHFIFFIIFTIYLFRTVKKFGNQLSSEVQMYFFFVVKKLFIHAQLALEQLTQIEENKRSKINEEKLKKVVTFELKSEEVKRGEAKKRESKNENIKNEETKKNEIKKNEIKKNEMKIKKRAKNKENLSIHNDKTKLTSLKMEQADDDENLFFEEMVFPIEQDDGKTENKKHFIDLYGKRVVKKLINKIRKEKKEKKQKFLYLLLKELYGTIIDFLFPLKKKAHFFIAPNATFYRDVLLSIIHFYYRNLDGSDDFIITYLVSLLFDRIKAKTTSEWKIKEKEKKKFSNFLRCNRKLESDKHYDVLKETEEKKESKYIPTRIHKLWSFLLDFLKTFLLLECEKNVIHTKKYEEVYRLCKVPLLNFYFFDSSKATSSCFILSIDVLFYLYKAIYTHRGKRTLLWPILHLLFFCAKKALHHVKKNNKIFGIKNNDETTNPEKEKTGLNSMHVNIENEWKNERNEFLFEKTGEPVIDNKEGKEERITTSDTRNDKEIYIKNNTMADETNGKNKKCVIEMSDEFVKPFKAYYYNNSLPVFSECIKALTNILIMQTLKVNLVNTSIIIKKSKIKRRKQIMKKKKKHVVLSNSNTTYKLYIQVVKLCHLILKNIYDDAFYRIRGFFLQFIHHVILWNNVLILKYRFKNLLDLEKILYFCHHKLCLDYEVETFLIIYNLGHTLKNYISLCTPKIKKANWLLEQCETLLDGALERYHSLDYPSDEVWNRTENGMNLFSPFKDTTPDCPGE